MIESWLELLCQCLPGLLRATVLRSHGGKPMCMWPKNSWAESEIHVLRKSPSLSSTEPHYQRLDSSRMQFCHPLSTHGVHFATLILECHVDDEQVKAIDHLLRWSQTWLELLAKQNREKTQQSNHLLDVLEKSSAYDDLAKNTYSFCSHLVTHLSLNQAVFCTCFRGKVKVLSVSKTPHYDSRTQPFEQLMLYLESVDTEEAEIQKKHYEEWLIRNNPGTNFERFPVKYEGKEFGYLVIYYSSETQDLSSSKNQIALFLRYLAPMYFKLYWAQLSVFQRILVKINTFLMDRTQTQKRIIYGVCTAVILACIFLPVNSKVKADAQIEGRVQRAIVVPDDGYLQDVFVKTGEKIKQGQLIALLDEKSIRLDVQRWQNEKQEYEREYSRELTALNHVQMRIAQAKIAQAQAKLSIYLNRLEKTKIVAPIDGVIINGDLSRSIGAPVKQGQVLYEMAPEDDYKLVLLVPEQNISQLKQGQVGQLQLTAFPSEKMDFEVVAISSIFEEEGPQLQYRVEAALSHDMTDLRPGMTGTGKIIVDRSPWIFIVSRPVVHYLKIWYWKIF